MCSVCKTAYASQEQFAQMLGAVEMTRHSECGHVISWRDGGTDWLKPYLAEPMQEGLKPLPKLMPRSMDRLAYVPEPPQQPRTARQP